MAKLSPGGNTRVNGNTLRVYLFLIHSGLSELRDIQRALDFSTPSLASYHLDKLIEAGYASRNERGQYSALGDSAREILEGYSRLGSLVVPQLFFFSVLFTAVVGFFAIMSLSDVVYVPLLAAASVAMVVVLWYETARVWRRLASWK